MHWRVLATEFNKQKPFSLREVVARVCSVLRTHHYEDRRAALSCGDLVLDAGHPSGVGHFTPTQPSIWSIKSGDDGVKPGSLRNEITSIKHPKVLEALRAGRSYVWCVARPAGFDDRDAMIKEAVAVAVKLCIDPMLIVFRWQDAITSQINQHPNVIAVHLPEIATRIGNLLTLNEWGREQGLR